MNRAKQPGVKLAVPSGTKFSWLTVVSEVAPYISPAGQYCRKFRCVCTCGVEVDVRLGQLRNGMTKSCGCTKPARIREAKITHGHTADGKATYMYGLWCNIKSRVVSRCATDSNYYADLDLYPAWIHDFSAFRDYLEENLGPRPTATSLDRIDNSIGYWPGNLRWATARQQAENKRNTVLLEYAGELLPLTQWSRLLGIHPNTIRARLKSGMSVKKALTTPVGRTA